MLLIRMSLFRTEPRDGTAGVRRPAAARANGGGCARRTRRAISPSRSNMAMLLWESSRPADMRLSAAGSSRSIRIRPLSRCRPAPSFRCPMRCPTRRAILAANMETALNALWDSGAVAGQQIAVIGAGLVGCLIASLASRLPGATGDPDRHPPERAAIAEALGVGFAHAGEPPSMVPRSSFTPAPRRPDLRLALEIAAFEAPHHRGELVRRQGDQPAARRRVPQPAAADHLDPGRPVSHRPCGGA